MDWTWNTETLLRVLEFSPPSSERWPWFEFTSVHVTPDACRSGSLFIPSAFELGLRGFASEDAAIEAAIGHGASAAMTNLSQLSFHPRVPVIYAPPTIVGLAILAQYARANYQGKVIAITGSAGKTTTKDLLHHALSHAGLSFKSAGTATINRPQKSQFTVVEIAATQPGHIQTASIARPHIGVVTNVGVSHLQNYRHPDDILREKISLFDQLEGERLGVVHRSGQRRLRDRGDV